MLHGNVVERMEDDNARIFSCLTTHLHGEWQNLEKKHNQYFKDCSERTNIRRYKHESLCVIIFYLERQQM